MQRRQLRGIAIAFEVFDLEPPDAVFRADRTAQFMHQIVDRRLDRATVVQMVLAAAPLHGENIIVQVAVAHMTETVDPEIPKCRDFFARPNDKLRQRPQGDRDIVAGDRPDLAVGMGHHLADGPEIFGLLLALRDQPVGDEIRLKGGGEQRFKRCHRVQFTAEPQFDQHAPFRGCIEGLAQLGHFFGQEIQPDAIHDFKGADHLAQLAARERQQFQRRCRRVHDQQRGSRLGRTRKEFQRRGGDDAKRALGPDQQMT